MKSFEVHVLFYSVMFREEEKLRIQLENVRYQKSEPQQCSF